MVTKLYLISRVITMLYHIFVGFKNVKTLQIFVLLALPLYTNAQSIAKEREEKHYLLDTFDKVFFESYRLNKDTLDNLKVILKKIQKGKSDSATLLKINTEIAKKYHQLCQNDSALMYFNIAENYLHTTEDHSLPDIWYIALQKADIYYRLGRFAEGLEYMYSVLDWHEKLPEKNKDAEIGKARLYGHIASFFLGNKQFENADKYIHKMNSVISKYKDTSLIVVQKLLNGWSVAESSDGNMLQALTYFQEAKQLSEQKRLQEQAFRASINIAVSFYRIDSLEKALITLKNAFEIKDIEFNPYSMLAAYSTIGEIYYTIGSYRLAKEFLERVQKGAEKFELLDIQMYANDFLSKTYKAEGNYEQALHHLEKQNALQTQLQGKEVRRVLGEMEFKYKTAEKDNEIVTKNLQLEQQQNRFKNYMIWGIAILLVLLTLLAAFRISNIKQANRIQILQREQEINNLKGMIQGEEQERKRIAGDLHDGIGALVAAIKMDVERIQQKQPQTPELRQVKSNLEETSKEIREVAHNLLPNTLNQNTLKEALLSYCNKISRSHNVDISLQYADDIADPESDIKLTIYRIFQELLQNIVKHAKASKAYIQVRQKNDHLRITVEDNGIGFEPSSVNYGLGINNIKLRVKALNGILEIDAKPSIGSTFFISFKNKPL